MGRRIEVDTLVAVFEKRIEALEKNPPELVPMKVIINLLEQAIQDVVKEHFVYLINKEIKSLVNEEFKKIRSQFVKKTVKGLLSDESFRASLEKRLKNSIIKGIEEFKN